MDLRSVVDRAIESVLPLIEQRKQHLSVSIPPEPLWLRADATRIEQIVVNLLNNAAKYTDEEGNIWLWLEQEANDAVLRLRDSGVGIAPELLPDIFDLFTQASRSLDRSQGWAGNWIDVSEENCGAAPGKGQGQECGNRARQ